MMQFIVRQGCEMFKDMEGEGLSQIFTFVELRTEVTRTRSKPEEITGSIKLHRFDELSEHFSSPLPKHLHIVVQLPLIRHIRTLGVEGVLPSKFAIITLRYGIKFPFGEPNLLVTHVYEEYLRLITEDKNKWQAAQETTVCHFIPRLVLAINISRSDRSRCSTRAAHSKLIGHTEFLGRGQESSFLLAISVTWRDRPAINGVALANCRKTLFCLGSDDSQQQRRGS
ncbi:hypothetical protein JOM56_015760 [Amanita muscaria]